MTKIVSITMAIIIMLTASVTVPPVYAAAPQTITASVKAKPSSHTNRKKKQHKHSMPKGNMGKWFKSKKALKKHVNKVMKKMPVNLITARLPGMNTCAAVLTDTKRGLAPAVSGQATSNTTRSGT